MWEAVTEIAKIIMPMIGVNLTGWITNSLKDNEIQDYEWVKLGETALNTLLIGTLTYFGASAWGVEISTFAASVTGALGAFVIGKLKKK